MKSAWEHERPCKHLGALNPGQDGFTRILRQFKLNWSLGLARDDRYAFPDTVIFDQVRNGQFHENTSAELATDGDVKQDETA